MGRAVRTVRPASAWLECKETTQVGGRSPDDGTVAMGRKRQWQQALNYQQRQFRLFFSPSNEWIYQWLSVPISEQALLGVFLGTCVKIESEPARGASITCSPCSEPPGLLCCRNSTSGSLLGLLPILSFKPDWRFLEGRGKLMCSNVSQLQKKGLF